MKRLNRRALSVLLTLCMALSLLPAAAFAEEALTEAPLAATAEEVTETPADPETPAEQPETMTETQAASAPAAMTQTNAGPIFVDGFGGAIAIGTAEEWMNASGPAYRNERGYTFNGFLDSTGELLPTFGSAKDGKTYTACWTCNGMRVRTTPLELTEDVGGFSFSEGWLWDHTTLTLTLNGIIFDVATGDESYEAISLPDGATIDVGNKTNTVKNSATVTIDPYGDFVGGGVGSEGALTIIGSGTLNVTGGAYGIATTGALTIKAPLTATATDTDGNAYAITTIWYGEPLAIDPSLRIETPVGGKIAAKDGEGTNKYRFVANSDGITPAKIVTIAPAPVSAPAFADGFGGTGCTFGTYAEGQTNAKGYTFAGWFLNNEKLTSADAAQNGATYTARWTHGGKIVRTTPLDLTQFTDSQQDPVEGWFWNHETKTLTLQDATIDVATGDESYQAINLPEGATITTVPHTTNTVINSATFTIDPYGEITGGGINGLGDITITGSGALNVTGGVCGIVAEGTLTVKAPLTAAATDPGDRGSALIAFGTDARIVLDRAVRLVTPSGGAIKTDSANGDQFIAESGGKTRAKTVTIGYAPSGGGYSSPSGTQRTVTSDLTTVTRVTVDGKAVSPQYYTVSGGNITFTDAFLKTLRSGAHQVTLENDRYIARGSFTVDNGTGAINAPKTGDAGVALYAAMAFASLLGSGVTLTRRRKEL